MLPNHEVQKVYDLAYYLHPDKRIALPITMAACEQFPLLQQNQAKRAETQRPYKLKLSREGLLQMSVYQASDPWERDQESANPRRKPGYRPTHDDMLGRYVKFLVWQTMDRRAAYTAVGLGCLLYTYRPGEICMLAEDLFDDSNIRRIKRWLTDRMTSRFRNAPIFSDDYHTFRTRPPTEHDRSVVHNALVAFTPWAAVIVLRSHPRCPSWRHTLAAAHRNRNWTGSVS
jgi:hypothetical protein